VHTLLHQHGCVDTWAAAGLRPLPSGVLQGNGCGQGLMTDAVRAGVKWLVFFQDTNALIFRSMAAVIGVSKKHDLGANSVCVPRTPGEAVGGICRLGRGLPLPLPLPLPRLHPQRACSLLLLSFEALWVCCYGFALQGHRTGPHLRNLKENMFSLPPRPQRPPSRASRRTCLCIILACWRDGIG
jgi:hypothetical protein